MQGEASSGLQSLQCKQNGMYSVSSVICSAFSGAYTVLSSMYSTPHIPDAGFKVNRKDSVTTSRYIGWFDLELCLMYKL